LAGEEVFGSLRRLNKCKSTEIGRRDEGYIPLNGSENCSNVIRWAPTVLQNVQTQLTGAVNIWMKHLADELDARRLVRIRLFKVHHEAKGAVLEGRVCWSNDDGVPAVLVSHGFYQYSTGGPYQVITLSATGEAETPAGGSVCMRLKSRMSRRRAVVDMAKWRIVRTRN
jgi:hypothetical protein